MAASVREQEVAERHDQGADHVGRRLPERGSSSEDGVAHAEVGERGLHGHARRLGLGEREAAELADEEGVGPAILIDLAGVESRVAAAVAVAVECLAELVAVRLAEGVKVAKRSAGLGVEC